MLIRDWIARYLAPPVFEDGAKTQQASLVYAVIKVGLAAVLVYGAFSLVAYPEPAPMLRAQGLMVAVLLGLYGLLRVGYVGLTSWILSCAAWGVVTYMAIATGGVGGPAVPIYTVPVLIAALLLGWRAGVAFAGLSILAGLGMLYAESTSRMPQPFLPVTLASGWAAATGNFVLVVLLLRLSVRSVGEALEQARRSERALAESNRALEARTQELTQRDKELQDAYDQLGATLSALPDLLLEVDRRGTIVTYHVSQPELLYVAPPEFLGKRVPDVLPEEAASVIMDAIGEAVQTGRHVGATYSLDMPQGTQWYELSISAKGAPQADDARFLVLARNVTERRQAEEALRLERDRAQQYLDVAGAMLIALNEQGEIILINRRGCQVLGCAEEKVLGKNWFDTFLPPRFREEVRGVYNQLMSGEVEIGEYFENPVMTRDGEERLIAWHNTILTDTSGRIVGTLSSGEDVTERRRVEAERRKWADVFENAAWAVAIGSADGQTLEMVNPAFARMYGYTVEELVGEPNAKVVAPHAREDVLAHIQRTHEQGLHSYETTGLRQDGSEFPIAVESTTVKDDSGRVLYRSVYVRDISKRKQAEEAYRAVVEHSLQGLAVMQDGRIVFANQALAQMFGYTVDDLLALEAEEVQETVSPEDQALAWTRYWDRLEGKDAPNRYELRIARKDGQVLWVDLHSTLMEFEGKVATQVAMVDITERRRAEEVLKASERRFRSMVEQSPFATIIYSPDGSVALANRAVQDLWALSQEAFDRYVANHNILADERMEALGLKSLIRKAFSGEVVTLPPAQYEPDEPALPELPAPQPRWVEGFFYPMKDAEGQLVEIVLVQRDITERVEAERQLAVYREGLEELVRERTAELEKTNERLRALAKVKDEFISGISHELRTPISSLKLYHRMLQPDSNSFESYLAVLQRETDRLHRLIEDVLYLSSLDREQVSINLAPVDLNMLAETLVNDRTPMAEDLGLSLHFDRQTGLPSVRGDVALLGRVLSILLTNAFSYTPSGGRVEVSTQTQTFDGSLWVGMSVSDNGPGIPPAELSRVFERFFRGRVSLETGTPGTGLGLATARELVNRHDGRIVVSSEGVKGKGATFTMWLPAAE